MNRLSQRFDLPPDISTHGADIDLLINFLHYFMIFLFVMWGLFMVYCLIRFRQRPGHKAEYKPAGNTLPKFAEIVVVIIEVILLVVFTMPVWASIKDESKFPSSEEATEIRVVAQQFEWEIHYPGPDGKFGPTELKLVDDETNPIGLDRSHPDAKDDITTRKQMHAPVNKPVLIHLTSKDVIHSFWIPMLRVKQDVIPGMKISIWFEATQTSDEVRKELKRTVNVPTDSGSDERYAKLLIKQTLMKEYAGLPAGSSIDEEALATLRQAGVTEIEVGPASPIEIQCAQLCGNEHYTMNGWFTSETQEEFDKWMEQQAMFLGDDEDDWDDEEED